MSDLSIERYERDIVDKLRACEKGGKGQLMELCTVEVGERQLPFVAFTTGDEVVVTARHHVNEFCGPTETVMRLAESGQAGLTLIPVVDVEHYDQSEARKEDIIKGAYVSPSVAIYDMFRGYKGGPQKNAENNWNEYGYTRDDSPPYVAAIKRLIDKCTLFIDLHNSAVSQFFFLTMPTGTNTETGIFEVVAIEMERRNQRVRDYLSDSNCGSRLASGVYEYRGRPCTPINYAASLGKMNLGFEIPVFSNRPVQSGKRDELNDVGQLAEISAGTISSLARHIGQSS